MKAFRPLNAGLWGISVALSWMWGLGLFFSVQFTFQFGFFGLLIFAITNAVGLFLFGFVTGILGERLPGNNSLEIFFAKVARPFRLVFYLYQLLAITLTIFAIVKYLFFALNLSRPLLVMPLTVLVVLAAACLFGEEFNIKRIKFSHGIMFCILLVAVGAIVFAVHPFDLPLAALPSQLPVSDWYFLGYVIPICVGFLIGPWLDLQQWQRAIQIQKEKTSVGFSYLIGASIFGLLLVFHGSLALWALNEGAGRFVYPGIDGIQYAHDIITKLMASVPFPWPDTPWVPVAYYVFIGICILTTLDSGYLALRWFLKENLKDYNSAILSLIPGSIITSPIPSLIFGGVFSLFATVVGLELEYFMVFYATFFVGYGAMAITRCFSKDPSARIPQIKMFSMGSLAVVIFAFGYFLKEPLLLISGSVLPLLYILWLIFGDKALTGIENVVSPEENPVEAIGAPGAAPRILHAPPATGLELEPALTLPLEPHQTGSEYFEGKWFVHSFKATYQDTNSTGNVYFGMYAMWVGKTRELFFHHVMPKFNVKDSPYLILTRSFEHKFIRETREFEKVAVKIRVANFNRKFVTMEHQIFDSANQMLGRGQQSLLFVSSKDYSLMDIPQEVMSGFTEHL